MGKISENGSYVLFVKTTCPFCHMAVDLLENKQLPYKKIVLFEGSDTTEQLKAAFGWDTVPIIFFDQGDNNYRLIGGYTDLETIIDG
jgi:glutaredoxin